MEENCVCIAVECEDCGEPLGEEHCHITRIYGDRSRGERETTRTFAICQQCEDDIDAAIGAMAEEEERTAEVYRKQLKELERHSEPCCGTSLPPAHDPDTGNSVCSNCGAV